MTGRKGVARTLVRSFFLTVYFNAFTQPAMRRAENVLLSASSFQELWLSTPAAFMTQVLASGTYCR